MDSPVEQRFLETALRPLPNPSELRLAVATLIQERSNALAADSASAERMIRRWNKIDARPKRHFWKSWRTLGLALAVLTAAWGFGTGILEIVRHWRSHESVLLERYHELNPQDRLLLGDPRLTTLQQRTALWKSEADNPAYFAEYSRAYFSQHQQLPPDFLKTAARIDPENRWFSAFAASVIAKDTVEKQPGAWDRATKTRSDPSWEILDEARYAEALDLLRISRSQLAWRSYEAEILSERSRLFSDVGIPERLITFQDFGSNALAGISFSNLRPLLASSIHRLAKSPDLDELRATLKDADVLFLLWMSSDPTDMLNELIIRTTASHFAKDIQPDISKLEIPESDYWAEISERFREFNDARQKRIRKNSDSKGGIFVSMFGTSETQLSNPLPLTTEDLKPARTTEHYYIRMTTMWIGGFVLTLVAAGVFLFRFRHGKPISTLCSRLIEQIYLTDRFLIAGAAIVLPLLLTIAYLHKVQLSGTLYDTRYDSASHALVWLALLLLSIVLPALLARQRLSARAKPLIRCPFPWFGGLSILGLAAIPIFLARYPLKDDSWRGEGIVLGLAAPALLWIAFMTFRPFLAGDPVRSQAVARIAWPAYVLGTSLWLTLVPVSQAAIRHAIQSERWLRPAPGIPAPTVLEYHTAKAMRTEFRDLYRNSESPYQK